MSKKPSKLIISTTFRNQRAKGPTSSAQQNDLQKEIIRDLSTIQQEWNNKIVPLMNTIPDGSLDISINAFNTGLDGSSLFAYKDATSSFIDGRYWNSTKSRPNTIYEQFANLFTYVDDAIEEIETEIENIETGTSDLETVLTVDSGILYLAGDAFIPVEDETNNLGSSELRFNEVHAAYTYTAQPVILIDVDAPYTLAEQQSNSIVVIDSGLTPDVQVTLPEAKAGLSFEFIAFTDTDILPVAGNQIMINYIPSSICNLDSGGNQKVVCIKDTLWIALEAPEGG